MRGPKPKPTAIRKLQGNPAKRPLNRREPTPGARIPSPPAHLDDVALGRWKELAPQLKKLGVLTEIDRDALAGYCSKYSDWVHADEIVKKNGIFIQAPKNPKMQIVHPAYYVAAKALKQMIDLGLEFGLTPSSRTRMNAKPEEPETPPEVLAFDGGKR